VSVGKTEYEKSRDPLDITVKEARYYVKRPRHLKAALYWSRRANEGYPLPPGCGLVITQIGGRHRPTLIDYQSLLLVRQEWNRGIVPPPMPGERGGQ
jgi:hypothetical protein